MPLQLDAALSEHGKSDGLKQGLEEGGAEREIDRRQQASST
jgi:hypothetical protein